MQIPIRPDVDKTKAIFERGKHAVDVRYFRNPGVPIKLEKIKLETPKDRQYILRMPICVDGASFHVPPMLEWIRPMLFVALYNQTVIKHSFCYVTVRHGLVTSETDDEWHVDGFSTRIIHIPEQNYIWSDVHPTEYAKDISVCFPSDFNPLTHNVNTYLSKFVTSVGVCEEETVYLMDPYMLHRRPKFEPLTQRTFVRISFVPIEINDINNTQNPLLPRTYTRDGLKFRTSLLNYTL